MNVCSQRRISLFLLWYVHFRKLQSFLPSLSDWIFRCCPIASNHKIVSKQTWDDSFSSRILVGDALLRGRCYNAITPSYDSFFFYGCGCGALSMFLMLSRSAIRKAVTNGCILCATHSLSPRTHPAVHRAPLKLPPAPTSARSGLPACGTTTLHCRQSGVLHQLPELLGQGLQRRPRPRWVLWRGFTSTERVESKIYRQNLKR